jgi:large subunit ribosomal protein L16
MPKRVKHRKHQRGRAKGKATRGNYVVHGDFGLQSLDAGWISARQIEAGRVAATHFLHGEGKVYIRVFPDNPSRQSRLKPVWEKEKASRIITLL